MVHLGKGGGMEGGRGDGVKASPAPTPTHILGGNPYMKLWHK